MIREASRIIRRISTSRLCWWIFWAPACLPSPMTIILQSPLSTLPVKPVWGLTRFRTTIPSDSLALRSRYTGKPVDVVPTRITSMEERMGARTVSSVMPLLASTSIWPAAVAPPWLPMPGITNGSAPASRTAAATSRTAAARFGSRGCCR